MLNPEFDLVDVVEPWLDLYVETTDRAAELTLQAWASSSALTAGWILAFANLGRYPKASS